jgi:hypothetical protein
MVDSAWDSVKKIAETLETEEFKSSFHDFFDEPALLEIMERQKKRIMALKLTKTKKPLPQIVIVCDDLSDTGAMHQATNVLSTCFCRGRHLGISTLLGVQRITTIHPISRCNFAFMLCWELRQKKELFDGLLHELSALHSIETLHEFYKIATEEPFSFLFVNLRTKPVEFWVRFEEKLSLVNDLHNA